jgi:hypothetical protein
MDPWEEVRRDFPELPTLAESYAHMLAVSKQLCNVQIDSALARGELRDVEPEFLALVRQLAPTSADLEADTRLREGWRSVSVGLYPGGDRFSSRAALPMLPFDSRSLHSGSCWL